MAEGRSLRVVGLFAGIGGIELGLHAAGHQTELLCEVMPAAKAVLEERFPGVPLVADVRDIRELPEAEVVVRWVPVSGPQPGGSYGRDSGPQLGARE